MKINLQQDQIYNGWRLYQMKNQYISKFKKFGYVKINLANKGKTDLTKVKKKYN